ncbi:hypothetical protein NC651_010339 [Populus alba x Populus x berolinensis]|nr:hypothetical protein NC651_010339 [Populus alba x Populus x berolinensis]
MEAPLVLDSTGFFIISLGPWSCLIIIIIMYMCPNLFAIYGQILI